MPIIPAATCNASDVQAAITASSNGDTVQLPSESSCTWGSSSTGGLTYTGVVTISNAHQITLDGNGSTITFAGNGTDPGFARTSLSVVTGIANAAGTGTAFNTVIKNFTFVGGYTNGRFPIVIISAPGNLPYRITNCTFSGVNGTALGLFGAGGTQGVIDHNSFTTTSNTIEVIHNFGSIDNNDNAGNQTNDWSSDVVPGGPNAIFVETNTFTGPTINPASSEAVENFSGSRIVFRHNTLTNVDFDAHGGFLGNPSNCSMVGTRWYEVYQNTWNLTVTSDSPTINMRQGSGVVWGNTHPATGTIQLQADCLSASSGVPYPFQDQDGRGITTSSGSSTTNASPIYIWNNSNFLVGTTSQDGSATTYIQLNRDYFVSANQPATLTRCQSAADVAAGCPVSYNYVPFTYPHPLVGGGGGGGSSSTIAWNNTHQTMDGFGGQTYQYALNLTNAQADMFFSPTAGIGLAYVRTDNTFDGSIPDLVTLQKAVARGAQVELTLQSPPCNLKWSSVENAETCANAFQDGTASSNGTCFTATQSLATSFASYATYIVNYLNTFASNGIPISVLGVQNEPENSPSGLGSCIWTGAAFDTFIVNNLGPAIAALPAASRPRLKFDDDGGWPGGGIYSGRETTCLTDASCAQYINIVSFHGYGFGWPVMPNSGSSYCCSTPVAVSGATNNGRHLWQGEINGGLNWSETNNHWFFDGSMADGLAWAQNIHQYFATAGASGWEYWELAYNSTFNAGLTDAAFNTTKRFYVVGNWSKFVRPGWVRIDSTTNPQAGIFVTAFKAPDSSKFAIVAINTNGSNTPQTFSLSGFPTIAGNTVTPNETSAALNLVAGSPLTVGSGNFTATLDANSVTTFTGTTGPITLLQRVQSDTCPASATACTVTLSATTAGSALICFANNLSPNTNGLASCTDGGDTFSSCTALGGPSCRGSFSNFALDMQASLSGVGGKTSITCNLTGANTGAWTCGVYELATALSGWAFDGSGNVTDNTPGTTITGVGLTLSGVNDAIVQALNNSGSVIGIDTGYALNIDAHNNGEALLANTTNGTAPTWTASSSVTGAGSALAIKTPTSGSPAVTLSSTSLFFGQVDLGGTSPLVPILVTNTGTGNLILANTYFTISGANVFDFNVVGGVGACVANQTLIPNASCTLYVTFSPQYPSARSASLALFDNAANNPQLIALAGQGVPQSVGIF